MFSERSPSDEMNSDSIAFAAALAGLVPQHTANRDRLMFLAGQASVAQAERPAPTRAAWRVGTTAAMLAASLAGVLAGWQLRSPALPQIATQTPRSRLPATESSASTATPGSAPVESRAVVPAQAGRQASGNRPAPDADYLDLRRRVLSYGVDSLPSAAGAGRADADEGRSFWQLRRQLLNRDVLPPPEQRSLDLGPPYPAGART